MADYYNKEKYQNSDDDDSYFKYYENNCREFNLMNKQ